MDDSDLAKMDQKDLERINLNSLKIMEAREQKIINAISSFDINALKDALETNKDKILSSTVWNEIHISMQCLNAENIDMFLFIKNLPQFEAQNLKTSSHTTITEQAICKSFFDEELFDFFYNHKEFSPMLINLADTYAFVDTVPKEVIQKLFQLKILEPTQELLNRVLDEECFNYLEYFLDNKLYNFKKEDYKKIYTEIWKDSSSVLLDKIKKQYPEYSKIPLSELIEGLFVFVDFYEKLNGDNTHKQYATFVGLDADVFSRTLTAHKLTKDDFFKCFTAFNSRKNNIKENFHCLVQVVMENYSDYYSMLKTCKGAITSKTFLLEYNKAMEYADLNMNLEKRDVQEKKLKL